MPGRDTQMHVGKNPSRAWAQGPTDAAGATDTALVVKVAFLVFPYTFDFALQ